MTREILSENTIRAYQRELRRFESDFLHHFGREPAALDQLSIRKYLTEVCPATLQTQAKIRIHFAAINHWLKKSGVRMMKDVPLSGTESEKVRRLTPEELQTLFEATRSHTCGVMLRLLYSTGIRLSELVRIRVEDILFETRRIRMKDDGVRDEIYFPQGIELELHRQIHRKKGEDFLFSLKDSGKNHISPRTLQHFLSRISAKHSLGKITIQTLRDNFALGLIDSGMDPEIIARMMGYRSQRGLARYRSFIKAVRRPGGLHLVYSKMLYEKELSTRTV